MHIACSIHVMRMRLKRNDITSENVLEFVPLYTALMGWQADAHVRISLLDGSLLYCTASGDPLDPPPARMSSPAQSPQADVSRRRALCEACPDYDAQAARCAHCGCGVRGLWYREQASCPHPENPRWRAI